MYITTLASEQAAYHKIQYIVKTNESNRTIHVDIILLFVTVEFTVTSNIPARHYTL